jgi:hypothetical protein
MVTVTVTVTVTVVPRRCGVPVVCGCERTNVRTYSTKYYFNYYYYYFASVPRRIGSSDS